MIPRFIDIVIQEKSKNDYRAFLHWYNTVDDRMYEIRGYGENPGAAANDSMEEFLTRIEFSSEYCGKMGQK